MVEAIGGGATGTVRAGVAGAADGGGGAITAGGGGCNSVFGAPQACVGPALSTRSSCFSYPGGKSQGWFCPLKSNSEED